MKIVTVLVLCGFSNVATANVIDVIATENANFTRIVLTMDPNQTWSVTQNEKIVTIQAPDATSYKLDSLQNVINRGRIKDVKASNPGEPLRIYTHCICFADFFLHQNIYLVVDLREANSAALPDNKYYNTTVIEDVPIWWRTPNPKMSTINSEISDFLAPVIGIENLEKTIAEDISIATIEGIITEANPLLIQHDHLQTNLQTQQSPTFRSERPATTLGLEVNTNLSPLNNHKINCNTFRTSDLFSLKSDEFLYNRIIKLRGNLYLESGQKNNDIHIETAITYLRLGLGREANQLLSQLDTETNETSLLSDIANFVTGNQNGLNSTISNNCPNSIFFWSTIFDEQSIINMKDLDRLIIYFKALTSPLQEILEKDFLSILEKNNFESEASEISKFLAINRDQIETKFWRSTPNSEYREPPLEIVQLANRDHPELMIHLLKNIDPSKKYELRDALSLSEAIRHDLRGTALWAELIVLESKLSLQGGDLISALARHDELQRSEFDPTLGKELTEDILLYATENAPANVFISVYLSMKANELADDTRRLAVNRLRMMGLPHLADSRSSADETNNDDLNGTSLQLNTQVTPPPLSITPSAHTPLTSEEVRNTLRSANDIRNDALDLISKPTN